MKSSVCKIEKGTKDLGAILAESEKVAVYNGLDSKQTLQLRLLCEELDGMLPELVEDFSGQFWIEFEDSLCRVCASITIPQVNSGKRDRLIDLAKNKQNAAANSIAGKVRAAIEDFFLAEETQEMCNRSVGMFGLATGYSDGVDYPYLWSLEQYRQQVKKEPKSQWDALEKSVIDSVADDITVGIRGKQADIVIIKRFA